jgi:hypothetical protein
LATTQYCKTVTKKVTGHSYFGIDIWWIKQRLYWCWKIEGAGGQVSRWISAATPKCAGSTYAILSSGVFWEFKGWNAATLGAWERPTTTSSVGARATLPTALLLASRISTPTPGSRADRTAPTRAGEEALHDLALDRPR